jgi:hypothetical protein
VKTVCLKGEQNIFPALKVPTWCSFGLLVEIRITEGKALGSEKVKIRDVDF